MKTESRAPTAGAMRAAEKIFNSFEEVHATDLPLLAEIIDRETGCREMTALLLESRISIGGDWRERRDACLQKLGAL